MTVTRAEPDGSIVAVRVVPGASRAEIVGLHGDELKVRVTNPPVGGRATAEVCTVLAEALGVRASTVRVVGGAMSRSKRLWVPVAPGDVRIRLGLGPESPSGR